MKSYLLVFLMVVSPLSFALEAIFYEHENLEGQFIKLIDNQAVLADLVDDRYQDWENRIDSVRLYGNTCVKIYNGKNYTDNAEIQMPEGKVSQWIFYPQQGREYTDHINLKDFFGGISSVELYECAPQPVTTQATFYKDGGLTGKFITFETNQADLDAPENDTDDWGKRISSIRLAKNTCITVYDRVNFEGEKKRFLFKYGEQTEYLTLGNFDNRIKSFEIYDCDPLDLGVTFYEHTYLDGKSGTLKLDESQPDLTKFTDEFYHVWNNRIGSIRLHGNTCVTVYSGFEYNQISDELDNNQTLSEKTFYPQQGREYTDYVQLKGFHDSISSIKVEQCAPIPVETYVLFYEKTDFKGSAAGFATNREDLTGLIDFDGHPLENRASSVKLAKNTCVTLYEKPNYRGRKVTLLSRNPDGETEYPYMEDFDNQMSSFEIYDCEPSIIQAILYQHEQLQGNSFTVNQNEPNLHGYTIDIETNESSSAGTGAAIGAGVGTVLPGVGTAIGAAAGAVVGWLFGGGDDDPGTWRDRVSSISLIGDTCARIYFHPGYQGLALTLYPKYGQERTDYNVLFKFNDEIDSIKLYQCSADTLKSLVWTYTDRWLNKSDDDEGMQGFSPDRPIDISNPFNPRSFSDGGMDKPGSGRVYPVDTLMVNDGVSSIKIPEDIAVILHEDTIKVEDLTLEEEANAEAAKKDDKNVQYEIPLLSADGIGWPSEDVDVDYGYTIGDFDYVSFNNKLSSITVKWMDYEMVKMTLGEPRIVDVGDTFVAYSRLDNFGSNANASMAHGITIAESETWSNSWSESVSKSVAVGASFGIEKEIKAGFLASATVSFTASFEASIGKTTEWSEGTEISNSVEFANESSIIVPPFSCTLVSFDVTQNEYEMDYVATLLNKTTGETKLKKGILDGVKGTAGNMKTQPCPAFMTTNYIPSKNPDDEPDVLYTINVPEVEIIDYTADKTYDKQRIKLQLRGYHANGLAAEPIFNLFILGINEQVPAMKNYPPAFLVIDDTEYNLWIHYIEVEYKAGLSEDEVIPQKMLCTSPKNLAATQELPKFTCEAASPADPKILQQIDF